MIEPDVWGGIGAGQIQSQGLVQLEGQIREREVTGIYKLSYFQPGLLKCRVWVT